MATSLIFNIQSKFDPAGTNAAAKGLDDIANKAKAAATSADNINQSLSGLKSILTGSLLALPFAVFTKGAIQSEEVTARFNLQLKALGQSAANIDFDALTDKAHKFGISQTELTQALQTGLVRFKSLGQELSYLKTAMGISQATGASLASSLSRLGLVTQGVTRIARQLGVSMRTDIKDPGERATAILEELRKKYEPLATATGTTAAAFKEMSVTIKDLGENVGNLLIVPLGDAARAFNNLNPALKEYVVTLTVVSATTLGFAMILRQLGVVAAGLKLLEFLQFANLTNQALGASAGLRVLGAGFATLGKSILVALPAIISVAAILAGIAAVIYSINKVNEANKKMEDLNKAIFDEDIKRAKFRISDLSTEMDMNEEFASKLKEMYEGRIALANQEAKAIAARDTNAAALRKAEREALDERIAGATKEAAAMRAMGVSNLAEYQKYQVQLANLRVSGMKDSLAKELTAAKVKAQAEQQASLQFYANSLEFRKAMTEKSAREEADIRKKWIDVELDYALLSKEEQLKFDQDYEKARAALAGQGIENVKQLDDATKQVVASTKGGQKALKEWTDEEAVRRVATEQTIQAQKDLGKIFAETQQLALAKRRLASLEEEHNLLVESGKISAENEAVYEKEKKALEEKVAKLDGFITKAKEAAEVEKSGFKGLQFFTPEKTTVEQATKAAEISLKSEIAVSITPNSQEIADLAGNKVKTEVKTQVDAMYADLSKRLGSKQ